MGLWRNRVSGAPVQSGEWLAVEALPDGLSDFQDQACSTRPRVSNHPVEQFSTTGSLLFQRRIR